MFSENEDLDEIAKALGPGVVDHKLREAAQLCWVLLPKERRSLNDLEAEFTRLLKRMFHDLREDELRNKGEV